MKNDYGVKVTGETPGLQVTGETPGLQEVLEVLPSSFNGFFLDILTKKVISHGQFGIATAERERIAITELEDKFNQNNHWIMF